MIHIKKMKEFESSENLMFDLNKIRKILSNIPDYVLKRQTKDFSAYNAHKEFGNPLSGNLSNDKCLLEGVTQSFPLMDMKRHIMKKYKPSFQYEALPKHMQQLLNSHAKWVWRIAYSAVNAYNSVVSFYDLEEWQFQIHTNPDGSQTHVLIIVPDFKDNVLYMDKSMQCFGYYRSCTMKVENIFPSIDNMTDWVVLQYEQRVQEFINEKIREETYLYHVSLTSVEYKIMKNGLVPKAKNDFFEFPERVYLLNDNSENVINDLCQLADMLYSNKKHHINNEYVNDDEYTLYRVIVSEIPKKTNFSIDYNFYPASVFTYDNIPPYALEIIGHHKVK